MTIQSRVSALEAVLARPRSGRLVTKVRRARPAGLQSAVATKSRHTTSSVQQKAAKLARAAARRLPGVHTVHTGTRGTARAELSAMMTNRAVTMIPALTAGPRNRLGDARRSSTRTPEVPAAQRPNGTPAAAAPVRQHRRLSGAARSRGFLARSNRGGGQRQHRTRAHGVPERAAGRGDGQTRLRDVAGAEWRLVGLDCRRLRNHRPRIEGSIHSTNSGGSRATGRSAGPGVSFGAGRLSERFHSAPALLSSMNRGAKFAAGQRIKVPAVTAFDPDVKPEKDAQPARSRSRCRALIRHCSATRAGRDGCLLRTGHERQRTRPTCPSATGR